MNKTLAIVTATVLTMNIYGQVKTVDNTERAHIGEWNRLPKLEKFSQEKVYLHFDKPYYSAGERMWFHAFVLDADNLTHDDSDSPLYVELIDAKDSVVNMQKIQPIGGNYSGSFRLDELIPEGVYTVRAYTNWMRNTDSRYFFHRQFRIGNALSSELTTKITYFYPNEKKGFAYVNFSKKGQPFKFEKMKYTIKGTSKKPIRKTAKTTYKGMLLVPFKTKKIGEDPISINVTYEDTSNYYSRTFIPEMERDFEVKLYPEGGNVVMGTTNCIVFKAVGKNGLGIDVTGTVIDGMGRKICDVKSEHNGIGRFYYHPDEFEKYTLILKTGEDRNADEKKVELPNCKPEGCRIGTVMKQGYVLVTAYTEKNRDISLTDSITLVGIAGDRVFYRKMLSGQMPSVLFNMSELPQGVAYFGLVNADDEILSERMVYVKHRQQSRINVDFMKPVYNKRNAATGYITVVDDKGRPVKGGNFSIAITDANVVKPDSSRQNIVTELLMNSELGRSVEKPGVYMYGDIENRDEVTDNLMITGKWKRYDVDAALNDKEKEVPLHELEYGYVISGQVKDGEKSLNGVQVNAYAPDIAYCRSTITNDEGFFFFKNLYFPQNTVFNISARSVRLDDINPEIAVDTMDYPEVDDDNWEPMPYSGVEDVPEEYLKAASEKYHTDNGITNVYAYRQGRGLTAYVPEQIYEEEIGIDYTADDDIYNLNEQQLKMLSPFSIDDIIRALPGYENWEEPAMGAESEYVHNEWIDGIRFAADQNVYSYDEVRYIDVDLIESVQLYESKKGFGDGERTLHIVFKDENPLLEGAKKQKQISIMPRGYAPNTKFYMPRYDLFTERISDKPDLRNTIYWNPDLTTDENGQAVFSFYMADTVTPYNIIVEGVTPQGEVMRYEGQWMLFYKEDNKINIQ